jgi:RNA polymerase sigma factor (sigma-70 family)
LQRALRIVRRMLHAPLSDTPLADLVCAARQGDHCAWDALVARYAGMVWAVARAHRLCDADAADASQATWLKLLEHIGDIKEPKAVGGWLATTARRECLRILRRASRVDPLTQVPETADDGPELDERLLTGERDACLWRAFEELGPRHQALLRMLAADPAPSYEEIGAALDMPVGSIGPTRARALEKLRCAIDRFGAPAAEALR